MILSHIGGWLGKGDITLSYPFRSQRTRISSWQGLAKHSPIICQQLHTQKIRKKRFKNICNGETCLKILMAGDRAFTGACATAEAVVV